MTCILWRYAHINLIFHHITDIFCYAHIWVIVKAFSIVIQKNILHATKKLNKINSSSLCDSLSMYHISFSFHEELKKVFKVLFYTFFLLCVIREIFLSRSDSLEKIGLKNLKCILTEFRNLEPNYSDTVLATGV